MKLTVLRETLLKPLQMVIGVVERKQTLPILSNVLLSAKDNSLSITGTDLEVELIGQSQLSGSHAEPYHWTVPGRKLMDICRALPENAPIEFQYEKNRIVLRSGRSRFTLSTLPVTEFPNLEEYDGNVELMLEQATLLRLLQRTYFSMAQQDVRYYLNGLLLEVHPNKLSAVATDGHRLALNTLLIQTHVSHRLQVIIPRKGVVELLRLLNDSDDQAKMTIGNNHIRIATNSFIFTSKLIEGRFPDYDRVIPKTGDKKLVIDRDILKKALQRSAILCNEKFKGVRLELRHNLLRLLSNNPEQEAAEEEIATHYEQDDLDIGFNVSYLIDILNTINSGDTELIFSDSNSSVLIREVSSDLDSVFVVMPMRL